MPDDSSVIEKPWNFTKKRSKIYFRSHSFIHK